MATILEARAIITAEDKTAAAFASIEKRLAGLTKSMKAVDAISSRLGGVARAVSGGEAAHIRRVSERTGGIAAAARGMLTPLALPFAGAFAVERIGREIVEKSAARMHERVRMEVAGLSKNEIADSERLTAELAQKFPAVSQNDSLHMVRNVRSVVGSFEEATKIMEPLLKFRVAAEAAHPGEHMEAEFDKLIKAMELKGVTQNIGQFTSYMDKMAKAINVFGDTLRPTDFYEAFKYGRQSTAGLSEEYMTAVAPTLMQRMGGAQAGTAQQALYAALVGGHMTKTALQQLEDLGLVDPKKVIMPKGGHLAGVKPGGILGSDVAASDPYKWVQDFFLPALAKKGITAPDKIGEIIATSFSKSTAAQLVSILATQQAAIEKDRALSHGAKGLEAADIYQTKDPEVAWGSLKNALGNFAGSIGVSNENLASAMNSLARTINKVSAVDPQDSWNRVKNKRLFEVDSGKDFSTAPVDDLVAAKREALQKEIAALPEKELRLYGVKQILEQKRARDRAAGKWIPSGDTFEAGFLKHDLEGEIAELKLAQRRLEVIDKTYAAYRAVSGRLPQNLGINQRGEIGYPGSDHPAFPMSVNMFDTESKRWRGGVPLPPRRPADLPGASEPAPAATTGDVDRALKSSPYGGLPDLKDIHATLDGTAKVTVDIKVTTDRDSIVKEVTKRVETSGHLSSGPVLNTGSSMPEASPGARNE